LSHRQKRLFTTACILKQATPIVIIDQPEFEGFLEVLNYLDRQGVTLILITNQDIFLPFMDRQEVFLMMTSLNSFSKFVIFILTMVAALISNDTRFFRCLGLNIPFVLCVLSLNFPNGLVC
jgi:hypothetical protein